MTGDRVVELDSFAAVAHDGIPTFLVAGKKSGQFSCVFSSKTQVSFFAFSETDINANVPDRWLDPRNTLAQVA
jgi:hypothetical protein